MKVKNLDRVLKTYEGDAYKLDKDKELTLRRAILQGVDFVHPDKDKNMSGEEKYKRHKIGEAVYAAKEDIDLKAEEIVTIKKCLEIFSPRIYGLCVDILEPEDKK